MVKVQVVRKGTDWLEQPSLVIWNWESVAMTATDACSHSRRWKSLDSGEGDDVDLFGKPFSCLPGLCISVL